MKKPAILMLALVPTMLTVKMTETATAKVELKAMLTPVNIVTVTTITIKTETLTANVTVLSTAIMATKVMPMAAAVSMARAKLR